MTETQYEEIRAKITSAKDAFAKLPGLSYLLQSHSQAAFSLAQLELALASLIKLGVPKTSIMTEVMFYLDTQMPYQSPSEARRATRARSTAAKLAEEAERAQAALADFTFEPPTKSTPWRFRTGKRTAQRMAAKASAEPQDAMPASAPTQKPPRPPHAT